MRNLTRSMWPAHAVALGLALLLAAAATPARAEYVSILVDEVSGHERTGWPIQAGVPIAEELPTDNLWLARVGEGEALEPVAFQVIGVIEADWPEGSSPRNPVKSIEIAFLADLPAGETTTFRLYHGEAARGRDTVAPPATLTIEDGESLARTVTTGPVRFGFHRHSGQLLNYHPTDSEHEFNFVIPGRERPVHHNPDTWAPPNSWGHASGWDVEDPDLAPEYQEARGPIAWRLVRTGSLPRVPAAQTSVTYTAFAGVPLLFTSSEIRFTRPTAVIAIRNNELVFSRGQHTHGLYIDHDGAPHAFRAYDPDEPTKHYSHLRDNILPPDTPLVALFSDTRRFGIGMVTLSRHAASSHLANAQESAAMYYFNDGMGHRDPARHFFYFTRAEVFNYDWNNWNTTVVPAGSVYAESTAMVVFNVGDEGEPRFEEAQRWTELLRQPPRVRIADGVRVR